VLATDSRLERLRASCSPTCAGPDGPSMAYRKTLIELGVKDVL